LTSRLLLDVSSLMYRSYFAMPDSVRAADGRPTGAVHGYLDMVARLLLTRGPDEIVHVYDHDWRPTARTEIYPGYKANRPAEPEGLPEQFALLRDLLNLTGMPQAQTPDWEAEDAIGALVERAAPGDRIEMVSGDRDLLQLVRDAAPPVRLLFTVRGVSELNEFDEAAVLAKYGVPASRYAEYAMLRGDPSDGLPGVPGVGEKTARSLIEAFGSIEGVLAAAGEEPAPTEGPLRSAALRGKLLAAAPYLDAMRRLVPVNTVAPLATWSGARDDAALRAFAERHALRGPVQRLTAALDRP
jgi:5'-3' exonuclease